MISRIYILLVCVSAVVLAAPPKQWVLLSNNAGRSNKVNNLQPAANSTKLDKTPVSHPLRKHRDCHEWRLSGAKQSGRYIIYPNGTQPVEVLCRHEVDVSYTVIQRRVDGRINFYTTYPYYKAGFGSASGDYWAGLDNIHALTINGHNKLRIDVSDWHGNNRYALYNKFVVMDESTRYTLFVSAKSAGTLPGDDLVHNNQRPFNTPDRPDAHHCAINQRAGWWFNYCTETNPNGIYYYGGIYPQNPQGYYDGIYWKDYIGFNYSLKFISLSLYK